MRKVYLLTSHSIAKFQSVSFARKMAEMTEVAARKYGRLLEAMDTLYANSTGRGNSRTMKSRVRDP